MESDISVLLIPGDGNGSGDRDGRHHNKQLNACIISQKKKPVSWSEKILVFWRIFVLPLFFFFFFFLSSHLL